MTELGRVRWPHLFSPLQVGPLTLPNRIVMPAMDPSLADAEGLPTPAMVSHYALRAAGGAGLVITGNVAVHPRGRLSPWMATLTSDRHTEAFAGLASAVHAVGGRLFVQLSHAGRQTVSQFAGGQPLSASAVPCPVMRDPPRAMDEADVEEALEAFAAAALRARDSGADGVEFHMAHGYLVCQFLSPYSNFRDDRWGGDLDGRVRFATEVVRRARALVGPAFPLQCRLSADERVEGGITVPLALEYAHRLVLAGADALSVSACNYESYRYNMPSYYLAEATYADLAAQVRHGLHARGVRVPVVAVGRFRRPEVAERALAEGNADLVAFGRALIADPDLPRHLLEGQPEAVRPCVACNRCAESVTVGGVRCLVNPQVGRVAELDAPVSKRLRVLVVGGGPAGLTCATRLARRGHDVTVAEASVRAGGKVWASAAPPMKETFAEYAAWLVRDAESAGVVLETSRPLHPADFAAWSAGYDQVIVAIGAVPAPTPQVPGLDRAGAVSHPEAALGNDALSGHVLVLGGGPEGCEVADALGARAAITRVSLVEQRPKMGLGLPSSVRTLLQARLEAAGISVHTSRTLGSIGPDGVQLVDRRGRPAETLPAVDHVVVAVGVRAPTDWAALAADGHVVLLGDARHPATILEAVADAERLGRSL